MKCLFAIGFFLYIKYVFSTSSCRMIADVIDSYKKPSSIIAKLCWPPYKIVEFYKVLADKNVQISSAGTANEIDKQFVDIEQHIIFIADLNCPDAIHYFEVNIARGFFRAPFRWFLIGDHDKVNEVVAKLPATIDMLPDSQVLLILETKKVYDMNYIYKISVNSTWSIEFYGSWTDKDGFQKSKSFVETTSLRRLDLDKYEISVSYVLTNNESVKHLTDGIDDHIDTITKVNFPTTNYLLDFLNARGKYVFADTWGYSVNGTWNGMTGYLVRGEVEIGEKTGNMNLNQSVESDSLSLGTLSTSIKGAIKRTMSLRLLNDKSKGVKIQRAYISKVTPTPLRGSPMFFTFERISIVDYIASPTPTRSKFVFQQPKLSYENNLFLLPFTNTVWYSTIALIFIIYLVLFIVTKWEWKSTIHNNDTREKDSGLLRANVVDVFILMFGAACQQGSPSELKGTLGRIVMLVLFLALMFLYTSYSANIVALLQSSSSHIKTLDDLLHSRLSLGVHDNVFNRYYFSTATEATRKAIYEKKVAPPGTKPRFMTMDDGVKKMRQGLFAFHMETGVGYKFVGKYFNEGQKCGLREIQYLQVIDPWLAIRKNSPYREMFKIGTKRIQEHGLQYRENRLMYEKRPKCTGGGTNFVSVSMVDCHPALLVLAYGAVLALFLLGLEIILHKRRMIKQR